MNNQTARRVVAKLISLSQARKLRWTQAAEPEFDATSLVNYSARYQTEFEQMKIQVYRVELKPVSYFESGRVPFDLQPRKGATYFALDFINEESGLVSERITSRDPVPILSELYDIVSNQASSVSESLSRLLSMDEGLG